MIADHFKDKIPSILKLERRWIIWRYEDRDGKPTKVPYCPWEDSGPPERADSTNPNTWGTYEQAVDTGAKYGFGIGFVLGGGYCGIDLDDVRSADGVIVPWAQGIIGNIHSYSEVSPSKTGGKIICKAKKPGKRCRTKALPGFEIYDSGRFFTLTGHHIDGTPATVEARQEQIEAVYWAIFKGGPDEDPPEPVTRRLSITLEDAEIVKLASGAKNGAKFRMLYRGDDADLVALGYVKADGITADHSSADQALVHILDWWTNSTIEQIDRIFRTSGLMRNKWEREDYRRRTIGNAVDRAIERYAPQEPTTTQAERDALDQIVESVAPASLAELPHGPPKDPPKKSDFVPDYFTTNIPGQTSQTKPKVKKKPPSFDELANQFMTHNIAQKAYPLFTGGRTYFYTGKTYRECQELPMVVREFFNLKGIPQCNNVIGNVFPIIQSRAWRNVCNVGRMPFWSDVASNPFANSSDVVAFENGLMDIGKPTTLLPHSPNWCSTVCLPFAFDPTATCPVWDRFLSEVFESDNDRVALLQEFFGYCLTCDTSLQKALVLVGKPRSGKGTVQRTLGALVGEESATGFALDRLPLILRTLRLRNNCRLAFSLAVGDLVQLPSRDEPSKRVRLGITAPASVLIYLGKHMTIHRYLWEQANGPIADESFLGSFGSPLNKVWSASSVTVGWSYNNAHTALPACSRESCGYAAHLPV